MGKPSQPFQPYAAHHMELKGPGDLRPTALRIVQDHYGFGSLRGKTICITGCSSGIGVETARALYETGARLFLVARDMSKLNKVIERIVANSPSHALGYPRPEAIKIELTCLASIRAGAELIRSRTDRLNILINNAGVMGTPPSKTKHGLELQMGTNYFGHFLLFKLLKPLLVRAAAKSSQTSRVINITSASHRFGEVRFEDMHYDKDPASYNKWKAYGQSKTADIYMANSITRHYASQGITGLSVNPGGIATDLTRHLTEEDVEALGGWGLFTNPAMKSAEQGAGTTVWAAISPRFEDVRNGGRYLEDIGEAGPMSKSSSISSASRGYAPYAYDKAKEEMLWKYACKLLGVSEE